MKFDDLGLSPEVLKAVKECGYDTPTPIQEKAIPAILMTRDVLGLAQTGTGKTAGFTLPMIEILSGGVAKARMPRSLVLAPTRELAAQVAENFDKYGKYCKLNKALLVGGESVHEQMRILNSGVDVLIATPGRLLDLFERGAILLNDIRVLVIDEADRMMDMGFIPDIEKIVSLVPPIRQTLLFSATMPKEIKRISDKFLTNPKEISVAPPASPAKTVTQGLIWVDGRRKQETLLALLEKEMPKNGFVFCNRKRDIDGLTKYLKQNGYSAAGLHGDMVQAKRYEVLDEFKSGKISLLICSDVAARGLDVAGVSHVFNYDVPMHADDYIHRIGRTGRAGQTGRAFMLAVKGDKNDEKFTKAIERLIDAAIPVETAEICETRPRINTGKNARNDKGGKVAQMPRQDMERRGSGSRSAVPKDANGGSRRHKSFNEDDKVSKGFGDDLPAFFK